MLSRISSWPEQKRLNAGLWCLPLFTLVTCAGYVLLTWGVEEFFFSRLAPRTIPSWASNFYLVSLIVFWLACPAFAGLVAAFFWRDVEIDDEMRRRLTFKSVVITSAILLLMFCVLIVFYLPFLFMFRFAVDRGLTFWNSNRPRQWLGDFSDMDGSENAEKPITEG